MCEWIRYISSGSHNRLLLLSRKVGGIMRINVLVQKVIEIDDRLYTTDETKKGVMTSLVRIKVEGDVLTHVGKNGVFDREAGYHKMKEIYSSTETNETWIVKYDHE